MVTPSSKQARGFAVPICVLLQGVPDLALCEPKPFPTLKALNVKTVGTYVAKQKGIDGNERDESVMAIAALVKKKPHSIAVNDEDDNLDGAENEIARKMASSTALKQFLKEPLRSREDDDMSGSKKPSKIIEPATTEKAIVGRAAPAEKDLAMVPVVQNPEPISVVPAATPETQRKLVLPEDFMEPVVTRSAEIEFEHSIAVNDEDDNLDGAENEIARKMASSTAPEQFLKEPLRSGEDDDMSGSKQPSKIIEPATTEKDKEIEPVATEYLSLAKSVATMTDSEDTEPLSKFLELIDKSKSDEESMPIEDILKQIPKGMMFPSVTATELTRIKFGLGIEIPGVNEGHWYKASLHRIATSEKGKAPCNA
ncbi:splicing factor 3B subunit 1-like [Dorcoceras hygrometricum]|uniref:Splicing factor 3B subunit 1-like n=1 Tax=Dorcoceras hygrometricum TaxID=472368 RepID=A0A2Z7CYT3_9LAMI|nr:splicing factor 3B subunit 1-like [Dorcoceras hygrometricum]